MQKSILYIIFILWLGLHYTPILQAQGWEEYYPKGNFSDTESAYAIRPAGSGYMMAGYTSDISNNRIATLTQLDNQGKEVRRIFSNTATYTFSAYYDLEQTPDGGFIAAGVSNSVGSLNYDWYLAKFDASGNMVWDLNYPPSSLITNPPLSGIYDVDVTPDSGFICTGYLNGQSQTIKTDSNGNIIWTHATSGVSQYGLATAIMPNQSGYATLSSISSGGQLSKYQLSRLNIQGDTIWTRVYEADNNPSFEGDLIMTNDGHFAITGIFRPTLPSSNRDLWIAKLDTANGNIVWEQFIGRSPSSDIGYNINNTLDGGLIASGYSYNAPGAKARLVKLDASGNILWNKEFGPAGFVSRGRSIHPLSDSSYIICGQVSTNVSSNDESMFAIRINDQGEIYNSIISGRIYYDRDSSCSFNGNDIPLSNRTVMAFKDSSNIFYSSTDTSGNYEIRTDTGTYQISLVNNYQYAYLDNHGCTPNNITLNLPTLGSTQVIDFPQVATINCPLVEVNMGTPFLRRCFTNTYDISYCNYGTIDAINTDIEVVLDPFLIVDTLNLPTPHTILANNTFLFTIDTIKVGQCGSLRIPLYVDCNSTTIGQTHCSQVSVVPDLNCVLPTWTGPNIELEATCTGDSISVTLRNVGGNMNTPLEYYVYEDNIMMRSQNFQLNNGQSQTFQVYSTGATYRVEAQQEIGFPPLLGDAIITSVVERCNSMGSGSLGFVTSLPNYDGSPFIDIDCRENIGAYDPNDKRGFPSGYGVQNYIERTTSLDYNIRFQNTGTDTAFTVVIVDTIDQALDILTLTAGASSHNYTMKISGANEQIVTFTFNNILLVDSFTNEPLSNGFIQFTIDQKPNNSIGTVINNKAAIYFDFNPPIITNTTLHTVGENFIQVIITDTRTVGRKEHIALKVIPNPFQTDATILVEGLESTTPVQLQVFNLMGQQVMHLQETDNSFSIDRGTLKSGMYVFRVIAEEKTQATGKFIIR